MWILLGEDDPKIAAFVRHGLKQSGFTLEHADNDEDGPHLALSEPSDIAIIR